MDEPRFAVDRMLGRLARWLRLLGFDAIYRPEMPGRRLLTLAAREGRILLTREASLARSRSVVPVIRITADGFREQLREVDARVPLGKREGRPARCGDCNTVLEPVAREALPPGVPEYVLETQSDFHRCASCKRVFWPATHWERMARELDGLSLTPPRGL